MAKSQLTRGLVAGKTGPMIRMGTNPAIVKGLKNTEALKGLATHEAKGSTPRKSRSGPSQPTGKGTGRKVSGGGRISGGGI
jgi:hypothetical protein